MTDRQPPQQPHQPPNHAQAKLVIPEAWHWGCFNGRLAGFRLRVYCIHEVRSRSHAPQPDSRGSHAIETMYSGVWTSEHDFAVVQTVQLQRVCSRLTRPEVRMNFRQPNVWRRH